jgi:hypothetical protein
MNIHTVAKNLRNTIKGKEQLLAELEMDKTAPGWAVAQMVAINIDELKRILVDVDVCCEQHTEMGWQLNPERMGQ